MNSFRIKPTILQVQFLGWIYCIAKNTVHSKATYSSVVAARDAGQKDAGSILLIVLPLFFKLEGYWFKSRKHSKSVNSVKTNKNIVHLFSLLKFNYITKKLIIYFLFKNVILQKQYHPIPHPLPFICARSMPQHRKKDCTGKAYLSLSVYLYLLVYGVTIEKVHQSGPRLYSIGHKKRAGQKKRVGQKKRAVFQTSAVYLK